MFWEWIIAKWNQFLDYMGRGGTGSPPPDNGENENE